MNRLLRLAEFYSLLDYFYKNPKVVQGRVITIRYYINGNSFDVYDGEEYNCHDDVPDSKYDKTCHIFVDDLPNLFSRVCAFRIECDHHVDILKDNKKLPNGNDTYEMVNNVLTKLGGELDEPHR